MSGIYGGDRPICLKIASESVSGDLTLPPKEKKREKGRGRALNWPENT